MGILDVPARNGQDGAAGPVGPPGPVGVSLALSISSGTLTLNPSNATEYTITLTGNVSLAVTNLRLGAALCVDLVQDGVGSRVVTIPTDWIGASDLALSTSANTIDTLVIRRSALGYHISRMWTGTLPSSYWSPLALGNRLAWFQGNSISGEDGDPVTTWTNQFAASNLTNTGGSPTLKILNGQKYVYFDGSDDHMDATHAATNQPFVLAFVAKVPGSGPVISGSTNTAHDILITSGNWEMEPASTLTRANSGNWQTVVCQYKTGGNDSLRVDGSEKNDVNVNTLKVATYTRVGGEDGGTHNIVNMAEIIKVSGTIDAPTLANMETYLNKIRDDLNGV